MRFRKDEIIFLFGAGISADAEIPTSSKMIEEVERLISENQDWQEFKDLYYLIKSGVNFSYGIQGIPPVFNIEVLVNILNELQKKEMHPLYPFIGSWHIKFAEVVGNNFKLIENLKKRIIEKLKEWVTPRDIRTSNYLKKLKDLKKEINFPLRIFTLNYDLLIEKNLNELKIERGFEEETRRWNYKRFIEIPEEPDIFLYKLHGSIDWERDPQTQIVTFVDSIPNEPDLIFGTQYKMQYIDPYLFIISEFRHYCLKAKLIVCLGYSFSDEHINSILKQSLSLNPKTKIFSLAYKEDPQRIYKLLSCSEKQVIIVTNKTAKDFFENNLNLKTFQELFTEDQEDIV
ncbi:MAG: SIR2 family protein [Candidatus Omnitrophica bacterium]|nr:SIR2 family protein [Candidatus Omnitrophota bacterium]